MAGTIEEERRTGSESYLSVLKRLHEGITCKHYLEIGVRNGGSLVLARCAATGVDPAPDIKCELPETTRVFAQTSDDFFHAAPADFAPDFCFIDGMHLFEYALRDFINFERIATPGAVVVFDDIFPNHVAQAARRRRTVAWTGDVWRVIEALRTYRPDLFILTLDSNPTGLALVAGLDPGNKILEQAYAEIVKNADEDVDPPSSVLERHGAMKSKSPEFDEILQTIEALRVSGKAPREVTQALNNVVAHAKL